MEFRNTVSLGLINVWDRQEFKSLGYKTQIQKIEPWLVFVSGETSKGRHMASLEDGYSSD